MYQQPPVEKFVQATLFIQLPLLVANVFEVIQIRVELRRKEHTKALKHRLCLCFVSQVHGMSSRLLKVRQHFVIQKLA